MNSANNANKFHILAIDDNRSIHEDFRKVLCRDDEAVNVLAAAEEELFGDAAADDSTAPRFHIDSAYQGQEGVELLQSALLRGERYAMAFVDVRMPPGWDGVETTARLWEVDPDLQIVICTAYSDYSWDDMMRKLKHSDRLVILKKPFDNIEVLQLANSLTRKWQLLQESKNRVEVLESMVKARTTELMQQEAKLRAIFENSPEGIFQTTPEGRYLSANQALASIYGYSSPQELMERLTNIASELYTDPGRRAAFQREMEHHGIVRDFESEVRCKDGRTKWISETACKINATDGSLAYYQGFVVDITSQWETRRERDLMEIHLRQAQKLESVGQLAAGIAHEINTPIQYIGDNIRFIEDSFPLVSRLVMEQQKVIAAASGTLSPELVSATDAADFAFLAKEVPKAIRESLDGVNRVASIVRAMKEFSHPGTTEKASVDLNRAINTVLTVARNEWKLIADVETELASDLPLVLCLPGEINQVLLNLIVNAAHAIAATQKNGATQKGAIKITTKADHRWAEIHVADNGTGIPEEIRHRIFEPFFTTKELGQGTGQGLAISRSIIVKKHGGQISFETEAGKGSTFIIRLPLGGV